MCLLHKLDLIQIQYREEVSQCFTKRSQSQQSKFVAWWTHEDLQENPNCEGSIFAVELVEASVETNRSEKMEVM